MFCYKCGKELPDDSEFCYDCGAKINVQPIQESAPSRPQMVNMPTPTADVPQQGTYIAGKIVKNKKSHKVPFLIVLGAVVLVAAILIYVLFTNGVINSLLENPIETPTGGSLYDRALIGRWRSTNGSTIELNSDGSGYTSLIKAVDSDKILFNDSYASSHSVGNMTWSSENGKLTFMVQHEEAFSVKYDGISELLHRENDTIKCGPFEKLLERKENTVSSGNYIGTWCAFNIFGKCIRELTLNDDGTGEVVKEKTNIPIEWEFKQEPDSQDKYNSINLVGEMYITYNMYHEFDYYKSNDSLTIYLSNSSMTFKKVSD